MWCSATFCACQTRRHFVDAPEVASWSLSHRQKANEGRAGQNRGSRTVFGLIWPATGGLHSLHLQITKATEEKLAEPRNGNRQPKWGQEKIHLCGL